MAYAVPHHGEGPTGALPVRRGPTRCLSTNLTPAYPSTFVFVLTGDVGGQVRGKRGAGRQEPDVGNRWG